LEVLDYKSEKNDTGNLTSDKHKQVEIENWKKKKKSRYVVIFDLPANKNFKMNKETVIVLAIIEKNLFAWMLYTQYCIWYCCWFCSCGLRKMI
jgi:hypothetical protein